MFSLADSSTNQSGRTEQTHENCVPELKHQPFEKNDKCFTQLKSDLLSVIGTRKYSYERKEEDFLKSKLCEKTLAGRTLHEYLKDLDDLNNMLKRNMAYQS